MMRSILRTIFFALALASPAYAAGTLPLVLQQQFAFTGCAATPTTVACGQPLAGGLLYFYQVGTVATRQDSFQDTGLSILNAWPLVLDQNGRVPPFYLADGSIHVRLTDSGGVVQFDYPAMLVIGPSSGGGGGSSIDPTTIAATGDIKFRITTETVTGWVKLNALTIGNGSSGATGRANADTQALFVYLWANCPDAHCPVSSGRGGTALADFNANKTLTLPDWRGRGPIGVDDMGNSAAGRLQAGNVTSGGGDGVTTANATGGVAFVLQAQNQMPNIAPAFTGTPVTPTFTGTQKALTAHGSIIPDSAGQLTIAANTTTIPSGTGGGSAMTTFRTNGGGTSAVFGLEMIYQGTDSNTITPFGTISQITPAGSVASINGNVSQQNMFTMSPFMLGSWYVKL